ncbi:hypothetical protein LAZ40_09965 [Cereibacter sphaeroides]|uniref:hypothetical protein n=1 Tax=Cereibacter sphaeroides TaxID=1063 RepID=UPI001F1B029B|nr:hypothetical protein [Cereibacter sphaeroides]MCE6959377.1 hypothetical protein [Cereibacter sphaeroides]MCE6972969.1 hypothetical protein [Cereibacter sphaeroides]
MGDDGPGSRELPAWLVTIGLVGLGLLVGGGGFIPLLFLWEEPRLLKTEFVAAPPSLSSPQPSDVRMIGAGNSFQARVDAAFGQVDPEPARATGSIPANGPLAPDLPEIFPFGGSSAPVTAGDWSLVRTAHYETTAVVAARRASWFSRTADLSPLALILVSGVTSEPEILASLDFGITGKGGFVTLNGNADPEIEDLFAGTALVFLIPATPDVEASMMRFEPGDVVHLAGWPVEATRSDGTAWVSPRPGEGRPDRIGNVILLAGSAELVGKAQDRLLEARSTAAASGGGLARKAARWAVKGADLRDTFTGFFDGEAKPADPAGSSD